MKRRSFLRDIAKLGIAASIAPSLLLQSNQSSTAPLKITAGNNLHEPECGTIEYDGKNMYYTGKKAFRMVIPYPENYK